MTTPVRLGHGHTEWFGAWGQSVEGYTPTYENVAMHRTVTVVPGGSHEVRFDCGVETGLVNMSPHMGMQEMRVLAVRVAPPLPPDRIDVTKVDYDALLGSRTKTPVRLPRVDERTTLSRRVVRAGKAAELKAIRKALKR